MESRIEPIVCHYGAAGRVMAYYVDAPCPTLIDTGGAAHPEGPIRAALQARGTDLAALGAIINTHGHWDHAGGNAATVAASGAGVLIHEFGAPLLFDHRAHLDGYYTEAQRALEQPALVAAQRATFPTIFGAEMVPGRLLRDGDRMDLGAGVTLQAIHVPGHSEDAIALWWEQEGILFAGDAAQGTGSRPGAGPLYFASIAQARASIARLRALPFRTLYTSHFFGRTSTMERAARYDTAEGRAFLDESSRRARSGGRGVASGAAGGSGRADLLAPRTRRDRASDRQHRLGSRRRSAHRCPGQSCPDPLPAVAGDRALSGRTANDAE